MRREGIDPEYLKEKYGSRIYFHKSIDIQYVLLEGTRNYRTRNISRTTEERYIRNKEIFGTIFIKRGYE